MITIKRRLLLYDEKHGGSVYKVKSAEPALLKGPCMCARSAVKPSNPLKHYFTPALLSLFPPDTDQRWFLRVFVASESPEVRSSGRIHQKL